MAASMARDSGAELAIGAADTAAAEDGGGALMVDALGVEVGGEETAD